MSTVAEDEQYDSNGQKHGNYSAQMHVAHSVHALSK